MRVLVEIGCGAWPVPRCETADMQYMIDPDKSALAEAAGKEEDVTPLAGSAAAMRFEVASIDTVIARNVFGDAVLGQERGGIQFLHDYATIPEDQVEEALTALKRTMDGLTRETNKLKAAIMGEVERVLTPDGKLIILETLTPAVAEQFLAVYALKSEAGSRLAVEPADIHSVVPPNYVTHRAGSEAVPQAWVGMKQEAR